GLGFLDASLVSVPAILACLELAPDLATHMPGVVHQQQTNLGHTLQIARETGQSQLPKAGNRYPQPMHFHTPAGTENSPKSSQKLAWRLGRSRLIPRFLPE